jgi:phosphoribosylanthranilate isomerase
MTRIKICGIKEETHALVAAKTGADFIGLVFAPSRRQITVAQAAKIVSALKQSGHATEAVGLFVNCPAAEINRIADTCHLDWVQLSGDESWEYCLEIQRPLLKVVRVNRRQTQPDICDALAQGAKILAVKRHIFLLDSHIKGQYGGTGMAFNWGLARQAAERFPVIIAGGLTPENAVQVIQRAAPWGVDVSTGVEVAGVKHAARIRAFVTAVRRADADLG